MTGLPAHDLVYAAGWIAAGAIIGASHFLSLRWNLRLLAGGRSLMPALAVQLGRFAAIAAILAVIARSFGALPLLAATLGILLARTIVIRREM